VAVQLGKSDAIEQYLTLVWVEQSTGECGQRRFSAS
jgi:hypothetical protein